MKNKATRKCISQSFIQKIKKSCTPLASEIRPKPSLAKPEAYWWVWIGSYALVSSADKELHWKDDVYDTPDVLSAFWVYWTMWKRTWLASKGALSSIGKITADVFKNSSSRWALSALENPPKAETSVMRWIPYHPIGTNYQEPDLNTNLDAIALFKKCPNRWVHQIVVLKDSVMTMAPINRWTDLLGYTDGIDLGSASNYLPHHLLADRLDEHCVVDSKHDGNQTSTGPPRDLWVGDQLDLSECNTSF